MKLVNIHELQRLVKEYEHCLQEVRVYKSHILALQEDLEEVENENNTLRLVTEKSEQSRRMSILITENESLFQYNNTLCQQLEDLEDDIQDKHEEESAYFDIENAKLTRLVEKLTKQNTKLDKELRQLKEKDTESFQGHFSLIQEKQKLDEKLLEMTDKLLKSEEKYRNLENEKDGMKKMIEDLSCENDCKARQIQDLNIHNMELASKEAQFEETLAKNKKLKESIKLLEEKANEIQSPDISCEWIKMDKSANSLNEMNKNEFLKEQMQQQNEEAEMRNAVLQEFGHEAEQLQ